MKEGALGLDMMPPMRTRRLRASEYRRERSKRIARKLVMAAPNRLDKHNNTQQQDNKAVVYQNLDGKEYSQCVFLDPYDILLAMNYDGDVDVVRIPRPFENSKPQGELMLGSVLARGVRTNAVATRSCKLKSIRRGEAFVVGMQDGTFKVYATEHASSWCAKPSFHLQKSALQQSIINPNASAPRGTFLTALWTAYGPQRRYGHHRYYSLLDQIRAPENPRSLELVEIRDWDDHNHLGRRSSSSSSLSYNKQSQWDFRETASSLMAVHVGAKQDFFGLRILDERVQSRNHVVIDEEMKNFRGCEEILGACFVSDWIVATLGPSYVKLWDIRRMKNQSPISGEHVVLPSFPRDPVNVVGPRKTLRGYARFMFPLDDNYRVLLADAGHLRVLDVTTNEFAEVETSLGDSCFATKGPGDMIANYDQDTRMIALYDVAARTFSLDVGNNQGRKRPRDGEDVPVPSGCTADTTFQPMLQDRYGLGTYLTDLSFSEHGDLAGCSLDGDLFVWRTAYR